MSRERVAGNTGRVSFWEAAGVVLLSVLGVAVASYQADRVAIIVDAAVYLTRGGLLQMGGMFPVDPDHGFFKGIVLDSLSLVRNVVLCQEWDSFTPLYVFWAKQVFRHSTSWLWTVHFPVVFWCGVTPGLLAVWLHRGPLRMGLPASLLAGWLVLWNPYLLAVARVGWLQPTVMSFVLLHLFTIGPLFRDRDDGGSPKERPTGLVLIGGAATALLMVMQHGSALFIAFAILSLLAWTELRRRPKEAPRRAVWYLIMILPAAVHLYHFYWCIFRGEPSFVEPIGREWERLLRQNGGTPFEALGWDLLVPGVAGLILALGSNRKLLALVFVTLFHALCTILWTYAPQYRYFYPVFFLLTIVSAHLFERALQRLPRFAAGALALVALALFPLRAHQSLIATKPSLLTNPVAWHVSQGGAGLVLLDAMLETVRELGRRETTVYVVHSDSGVFYSREVGTAAVSADEGMIQRDLPRAVIATDSAWSDSFAPWFLARYRKARFDGRNLFLFLPMD